MFEMLEGRCFLNGTVRVSVNDGNIMIRGDSAGNAVTLFRPDDGSGDPQTGLRVAVSARTKLVVNGAESTDSVVLATTSGSSLTVDLDSGEDFLNFESRPVFGNADIRLGEGNNVVTADAQFANLAIGASGGEDRLTFYPGTLATGNVAITTGAGRDRISFDSLGSSTPILIGGKLLIDDRQGPTGISAAFLSVRKQAFIATGNSIDRITIIDSVFNRDATISTRDGDDVINLSRTVFKAGKNVLPGRGNNT